ncbi:hypothetical protein CDV36_015698, partial [Fusarium kuroshium]
TFIGHRKSTDIQEHLKPPKNNSLDGYSIDETPPDDYSLDDYSPDDYSGSDCALDDYMYSTYCAYRNSMRSCVYTPQKTQKTQDMQSGPPYRDQTFFDQKSIEAKKECLWTYILTLSGLDVLNSIRLRYVKWKLYTHWIKWKGDSGKAKAFLQLLEDRGIILDLTDFKTWMLEGFTYDVFVQEWKEGSLIGTDLTATEARDFPRKGYDAELGKHRKRGIKKVSEDCEHTGVAFSLFLDKIPLLDNFIPNSSTTQHTNLKRKPSQTLTRPNRLTFCTDKTLVGYPLQTEHASSPVITEIRNVVERGEADVGNPQQLSPSPTVYSEGTAMSTNDTEPGTTSHLQARDLSSQRRYQSVPLPTMPNHATGVPRLNPVLASFPRPALNNRISPPTIQIQPNSPVIQSHIPESSSLGCRAGSWDELRIQTPSPSPGLQPNQQSEATTAHQPVLSSPGPRGQANATTDDIDPNSMPDSSMQGLPLIQSHHYGPSHGAAETHHPHQNCSPPQPPTPQMAPGSTVIQGQVARASSSGAQPASNQVMAQEPPSSPPSCQRSKACIPSHPAPPTSPDINSAPAEQGQLRPGTTPPIPMAAATTGVLAGISANSSSLLEFCSENAESQVSPHSIRNSAITRDSSSPQPRSSESDFSKEDAPINTKPSPGPQPENSRLDGHCLSNEALRNSAFPQGPQNDVPGLRLSQGSPERITIDSFLDPLSSSQHTASTQQQWWALGSRLPDEFTDPRPNDAFLEPGASLNMDTALDTSIDWTALGFDLLSEIPDTLGKEVFENSGDTAPL